MRLTKKLYALSSELYIELNFTHMNEGKLPYSH